MTQKIDFSAASSADIIAALGRRIDVIRLSHNVSQADLAEQAGVSRSTITRLGIGQAVSLDSFIRVVQALGLTRRLEALIPDPSIRPVERMSLGGGERRRARARTKREPQRPWAWGEDEDAKGGRE